MGVGEVDVGEVSMEQAICAAQRPLRTEAHLGDEIRFIPQFRGCWLRLVVTRSEGNSYLFHGVGEGVERRDEADYADEIHARLATRPNNLV
jgi:hypothetical protein